MRRRPGLLLRLIALTICALTAVACGAKPEPTSGKLDTTYPATVRDGSNPNRIISVEAPPRLVFVVDGGPERLLARLGVRAATAPADVTAGRIASTHPDLVVLGPGVTAADEQRNERFVRLLTMPVFVMPGGRLEDIERGAVALGVVTNHAEAGRTLALQLRRERDDIARRLARVEPVTVYVDAGFGASIQRTTLLARLITLAGGKLVGPSDGVTTINAKQLHKLDPDVYIATNGSGVTLARMRAQPRLKTLRSIAAGRFFVVDTGAARADTTAYALLHSLAHQLHPTVIKQ